MLRTVILFCGVALAWSAPNANIFQIDLDPEEAAKYINNPPFTEPALSGRTAVLPLIKYNDPRFRTAEAGPTLGHYWKNGREIENTDDYVEEVYNAKQYHGQDGLGAYAYGYETPESAKTENKQRSGNVQGAYTYKAGSSNDLIKVRYWADSQGFHQEDNIPKYVPKQVEEAPEVKAARLAHEKAWQEAAYANLHPGASNFQNANPTPNYNAYQQNQQYQNQNYQNQNYQKNQYQNQYQNQQYQQPNYQQYPGQYQNQNFDYQTQASEQQSTVVAPPQQRQARQFGQNQYQGQYQGNYQGNSNLEYPTTTTTTERYQEPEPTGPPRGFFYSFDYPVSIIVPKSELQGGATNQGYPVDHDTIAHGRSS